MPLEPSDMCRMLVYPLIGQFDYLRWNDCGACANHYPAERSACLSCCVTFSSSTAALSRTIPSSESYHRRPRRHRIRSLPVHRSAILLTSIEVLKQCNHVIGNPTVMMTVIVLLARSSVAQLCGSQAATDAAVHLSAANATANAAIYVPAAHVPAACTATNLPAAVLSAAVLSAAATPHIPGSTALLPAACAAEQRLPRGHGSAHGQQLPDRLHTGESDADLRHLPLPGPQLVYSRSLQCSTFINSAASPASRAFALSIPPAAMASSSASTSSYAPTLPPHARRTRKEAKFASRSSAKRSISSTPISRWARCTTSPTSKSAMPSVHITHRGCND